MNNGFVNEITPAEADKNSDINRFLNALFTSKNGADKAASLDADLQTMQRQAFDTGKIQLGDMFEQRSVLLEDLAGQSWLNNLLITKISADNGDISFRYDYKNLLGIVDSSSGFVPLPNVRTVDDSQRSNDQFGEAFFDAFGDAAIGFGTDTLDALPELGGIAMGVGALSDGVSAIFGNMEQTVEDNEAKQALAAYLGLDSTDVSDSATGSDNDVIYISGISPDETYTQQQLVKFNNITNHQYTIDNIVNNTPDSDGGKTPVEVYEDTIGRKNTSTDAD
jgi:hypothetical protein